MFVANYSGSLYIMLHKGSYVVKFVAVVLSAYGLWMVLAGSRGIWLALRCLVNCPNVDLDYIWFIILSFGWSVFLPAAAFVSAYGSFKLRPWGRRLALVVCSILFLLELYGTVKFAILSYQFRDVPIPPIPDGAVEVYVSMRPAYIIGVVSGLLLLLLLQPFVKKACSGGPNA
jgi:hypothetical protein